MDIAALKEEARTLEQQGRPAEALALYRKALARLEGTQDIWRELPLYVKAGDLNLKLRDGKTAIAMYERAAKRYAQYGSGKSVLALCAKILRVAPSRSYVFLAFARVMIERGHVAEAAKVVAGYAELVKLGKAREVIQRLAAAGSDETRPVLEMLLEVAGRAETAKLRVEHRSQDEAEQSAADEPDEADRKGGGSQEAKGQSPRAVGVTTGERVGLTGATGPRRAVTQAPEGTGSGESVTPESSQGQDGRESETPEGPADPAQTEASGPREPPSTDEPAKPSSVEVTDSRGDEELDEHTFQVTQGYTPVAVAEALSRAKQAVERAAEMDVSATIEPPPKREPDGGSHAEAVEPPAPAGPASRSGDDSVRPRPPLTRSGPRPQHTFTAHRPKSPKRGWPWAVLAVILIGGGGAGLMLGRLAGGGEQTRAVDQPADASPGDSEVVSATEDTMAAEEGGQTTVAQRAGPLGQPAETTVAEVVDSVEAGLPAPTLATPPADSLVRAAPEVSIDTGQTLQTVQPRVAAAESVTVEPTLPNLPPDVTITRPIIVIRGLPIESVTEFPDGEHRVVQLLGSGERLVLTARPVTEAMADNVVDDTVTVRAMPGASTVGSVRHADHLVEAQGIVPADTLRMLLRRLAEIRP
jgi:hypothetical protein